MSDSEVASYYRNVYEPGLPELDLEGDNLLEKLDRQIKLHANPALMRVFDKLDQKLLERTHKKKGRGELSSRIAGLLNQTYGLDAREARAVTRGLMLRAERDIDQPDQLAVKVYRLVRNQTAVAHELYRYLGGWGETQDETLQRVRAIDPYFHPTAPVPDYNTALEKRSERLLRKVLLKRKGFEQQTGTRRQEAKPSSGRKH